MLVCDANNNNNKQLQMVLYKPDYNSNDCKLPNEKATPTCEVDRLPYYSSTWLGVDSWFEESDSLTIDSCIICK